MPLLKEAKDLSGQQCTGKKEQGNDTQRRSLSTSLLYVGEGTSLAHIGTQCTFSVVGLYHSRFWGPFVPDFYRLASLHSLVYEILLPKPLPLPCPYPKSSCVPGCSCRILEHLPNLVVRDPQSTLARYLWSSSSSRVQDRFNKRFVQWMEHTLTYSHTSQHLTKTHQAVSTNLEPCFHDFMFQNQNRFLTQATFHACLLQCRMGVMSFQALVWMQISDSPQAKQNVYYYFQILASICIHRTRAFVYLGYPSSHLFTLIDLCLVGWQRKQYNVSVCLNK